MVSSMIDSGEMANIANSAGLPIASYDRVMQLLTAKDYDALKGLDGDYWTGQFNTKAAYEETRAKLVAILWRRWDELATTDALDFQDISKSTIDNVLETKIRPLVSGLVDSDQVDYVMAQFTDNIYKELDLQTADGTEVANRVNAELDKL